MDKSSLRTIYDSLPPPLKTLARTIRRLPEDVPFTSAFRKKRWIRDVYTQFGLDQRRNIFLSIARFAVINRPIDGYYFEFGCHGVNTMRLAYDAFHHLFDWTYVAFDSFEGLPEIQEIDKQAIWEKGKLRTDEDEFVRTMQNHGMRSESLITVKGFYDKSLTPELKAKLLPKKAAVVYIDCDLYTSTVPVLRFIKDFLQQGTIIVFDDWNCFYGDPNKGERKAFAEFRESESNLAFEEFISTNEAKSFIFLGSRESVS